MSAMYFVMLLALALSPSDLPAQTRALAAPTEADETITAEEVARHVAVLGGDSLQDRDTPSPALEHAAAYVAEQFRQAGLTPGGKPDGAVDSWLQRYPIPGQLRFDYAQSTLSVTTQLNRRDRALLAQRGEPIFKYISVTFTSAARFVGRVVPRFDHEERRRTVLVAGRHTPASLRGADVHGSIVLYVPPAGADSAQTNVLLERLAARSHGVILLSPADSAVFAAGIEAARHAPVLIADDYLLEQAYGRWVVQVWPGALREVLAAAGVAWDRLAADTTPVVRALPFTQVSFHPAVDTTTPSPPTAPNVVGVLEGSDPQLNRQYVLFLAHLDQRRGTGLPGLSADSAAAHGPAADDRAVGVAGLIALAKAFSQSGARPRRSLMFLAVSGSHEEFWGSSAFIYPRLTYESVNGPLPVLAITLDLNGRAARDSVAVAGLTDVALAIQPALISLMHPELGLALSDGGTVFRPESDAYAFARSGVPSLRVDQCRRPGAEPGDAAIAVEAEATARVLRLAFHLARAVADADQIPRLSAEGRRNFLAVGR